MDLCQHLLLFSLLLLFCQPSQNKEAHNLNGQKIQKVYIENRLRIKEKVCLLEQSNNNKKRDFMANKNKSKLKTHVSSAIEINNNKKFNIKFYKFGNVS